MLTVKNGTIKLVKRKRVQIGIPKKKERPFSYKFSELIKVSLLSRNKRVGSRREVVGMDANVVKHKYSVVDLC